MSAAACRAPSTCWRGDVPRRAAHHAGPSVRQRPLLPGRGASHRHQYPRSGLDHRRHPCPGPGDAGREREILRLVDKYGRETVASGFAAVQDYVERAVRQRLAALPDGEWETQDFIDRDPSGSEGMIPIKVKITIEGDKVDLRFHRQPSDHRLDLQFRVRGHILRRRRRHEDVLPRPAAELRLLSRVRDHRARGTSSTRNGRSR